MTLTNKQWKLIEPLIPERKRGPNGSGRPPRPAREVLDGILWIMRTGAPWKDLPERYPPYQTCHRRFQQWVEEGVFGAILVALREDLKTRGGVDDIEAFIDGTYVPAKRGALKSADLVPARRQRSWQLQTALVFQSLSLLQTDPDTTLFSPTELSTLLSSITFRRS